MSGSETTGNKKRDFVIFQETHLFSLEENKEKGVPLI
jgi:hypothetical protein